MFGATTNFKTLPADQNMLVPKVRSEWLEHGLSTRPADRAKAESGARLAYRQAGLLEPREFIWFDSPLRGAIASAMLEGRSGSDANVRAIVRDHSWARVRSVVRGRVWEEVLAQIWSEVEEKVGGRVWRHLLDALTATDFDPGMGLFETAFEVRSEIQAQTGDQSGLISVDSWETVGRHALKAIYGQHDAADLSYFDFLGRCGIGGPEMLEGITTVAKNAGWWWPMKDVAIITERPAVMKTDLGGLLHCETETALCYPDGWGIRAIHGVRIAEVQPLALVNRPESRSGDGR